MPKRSGFIRICLGAALGALLLLLSQSRIDHAQATSAISTPVATEASSVSTAEAPAPLYPLPIEMGGKWGYMDTTGKVVIPPQFDHARPFYGGLAEVSIDKQGAYIDPSGAVVIQPQFEDAADFHDGMAVVNLKDKGGWGFIDTTGKFVIPLQQKYDNWHPFSEGLAAVNKGAYWGFIDKTGKVVIPLKYRWEGGDFHEGLAEVPVADTQGWGSIDEKGKVIIRGTSGDFSEGLSPWRDYSKEPAKFGYVDTTGKLVIQPQFDMAGSFSEGLAVVVVDLKSGYIDKTGAFVIQPQFSYADPFHDGLAAVWNKDESGNGPFYGKYSYVDTSGKVVIQPEANSPNPTNEKIETNPFDTGVAFNEGMAVIEVGQIGHYKYGYIDTTGKVIWEPSN